MPRKPKATPATRKPTANEGWEAAVWRYFIRRAGGDCAAALPSWADRPAVVRFGATSPALLAPFTKRAGHLPYADQIKPFNFLLAPQLRPLGTPAGADPRRCRLVGAFTRDPREWFRHAWHDLHSPVTCRLSQGDLQAPGTAVVKSVRQVVEEYWDHPEAKSLAPDGGLCGPETRGLLRPRPVTPLRWDAIGKEANRLEEVELGLITDAGEVQQVYQAVDPRQAMAVLRHRLAGWSARALARQAGMSDSTAYRFRRGDAVSGSVRRALEALAGAGHA